MLNGGYSWHLFFYVEFAFGAALFLFAFFAVEETAYNRKKPTEDTSVSGSQNGEKASDGVLEMVSPVDDIPPRKTFMQTLKFWGVWEKDSEFFMMIARSFTYFFVPHVFWVITTYGGF